jgi:hydrogenase expression/formation protein HypD
MTYIEEFNNPNLVKGLIGIITKSDKKKLRLMMGGGMIAWVANKTGLIDMLPQNVELIHGPGCPRCVTPASTIDYAVAISKFPKTIVTIYGGMMMIPGSKKSLDESKSEGGDIRPVYSCLEALEIAKENPKSNIIFVSLGYETTSPTVASTILEAKRKGIKNFFITRGHLTYPSVFKALLKGRNIGFDGLLLPGPVCTITGSKAYEFISDKYEIPCVITGLEISDILQSIHMLQKQIFEDKPDLEIQYTRCVNKQGNLLAKKRINDVFENWDSPLRGFGIVQKSGLTLRKKYDEFKSDNIYDLQITEKEEPKGCICLEVMRGLKVPTECSLFGKACNPKRPLGACMVGGTCNAYFIPSG